MKSNQEYLREFAVSLRPTKDYNVLRVVRDNQKFLEDLQKPENKDILDIVTGKLPKPF